MIASVFLLYFQLAKGSDGGKMITKVEWARLLKTGLVNEHEIDRLRRWCGVCVERARLRVMILEIYDFRAATEDAPNGRESTCTRLTPASPSVRT